MWGWRPVWDGGYECSLSSLRHCTSLPTFAGALEKEKKKTQKEGEREEGGVGGPEEVEEEEEDLRVGLAGCQR